MKSEWYAVVEGTIGDALGSVHTKESADEACRLARMLAAETGEAHRVVRITEVMYAPASCLKVTT